MLTIKTLENIKLGARITLINGIYAAFVGAFYMLFFNFVLKTNMKAIDVIWQVFAKYNPEVNSLFVRLMILKGVFIIAIGVLLASLSYYILKKKDRGTWITLFIVGLIFWPSILTFEVLDKNIYLIIADIIGWITFLIGMFIPFKYFIREDYEGY